MTDSKKLQIWKDDQTQFEQQLSDSQVLSLTLKQRGYRDLRLTDASNLRMAHLCLDFSLSLTPNCSPSDAAQNLRTFLGKKLDETQPDAIITGLKDVFEICSPRQIIREDQSMIWQLTNQRRQNMLFIYKSSGEYYALGHPGQYNTVIKLLNIYTQDTGQKPGVKKIIAALYKMFNGMSTKNEEPCYHRIEILKNQLHFEIFGGKTAETSEIGFDFFRNRMIQRKTGLGPTRQAFYTIAELADRPWLEIIERFHNTNQQPTGAPAP
ncbi:MAG: hypothetical protein COV52_07730 [Gammaproteobacteria bacterium CG11_big_fil_rev_8_21_14_0_20_46_22]|nr:MAG: hypothetical protein COW05_03810 [Gammaproteobacteria bacterium CG12_big_fil_rev_8_21_14_0_65_46_12]PIR10647.1 MAG: hypothetical protein COV52_07730 [Gammaproteobacteria bacterium CG11_big_fil_rev_8_21_14_0_20_46_22]